MQKDFDGWNSDKKEIEMFPTPAFYERGIWWCSIGVNVGDEEDGKMHQFERPVLILRKFNKQIAWVLPMSTKHKNNDFYHNLEHDGVTFFVILSQLRLISVKRFRRFMRKISPHQFKQIQLKVIALIRISP